MNVVDQVAVTTLLISLMMVACVFGGLLVGDMARAFFADQDIQIWQPMLAIGLFIMALLLLVLVPDVVTARR